MMSDDEIDRARALELARMVLRENAIKLYGFKFAKVLNGGPADLRPRT